MGLLDLWDQVFGLPDSQLRRITKKHFKFLITEYKLTLDKPGGNEVIYSSSLCRVSILQEFEQIRVTVYPPGPHPMLGLEDIVGFKRQEMDTSYISDHMPNYHQDQEGALERKLAQMSSLLHLHADDFLRGDFSHQADVVTWANARFKERTEKLLREGKEKRDREAKANGSNAPKS